MMHLYRYSRNWVFQKKKKQSKAKNNNIYFLEIKEYCLKTGPDALKIVGQSLRHTETSTAESGKMTAVRSNKPEPVAPCRAFSPRDSKPESQSEALGLNLVSNPGPRAPVRQSKKLGWASCSLALHLIGTHNTLDDGLLEEFISQLWQKTVYAFPGDLPKT